MASPNDVMFSVQSREGVGRRYKRSGPVCSTIQSVASGGRATAHKELASADSHPFKANGGHAAKVPQTVCICFSAEGW